MKKPELGAIQRTEMAERIEVCARELRSMVRKGLEGDAETLVNRILDDLAILDTKRVKQESRKAQSLHVQAALSAARKL